MSVYNILTIITYTAVRFKINEGTLSSYVELFCLTAHRSPGTTNPNNQISMRRIQKLEL